MGGSGEVFSKRRATTECGVCFPARMKHITLILSIAATALLTLPTLSIAADEKPAGQRQRMSPEERLKKMTEQLGLSQDQQDKIKAIFEKNAPALKEIFSKGRENLTEEDKTKMRDLLKAQAEDISAVLTPEQKEKWKVEMEKRRGGGPGGDKPANK
jgi:Spy/CpxP family protein refolding chaperone